MSSRSLVDLDSRFRPIAEELIAKSLEAGVPLTIITTLRSYQEQELAVQHGTSWTMKSLHLPQPPDGKSLAIDVCPTELLTQKNWAPLNPLWWIVAQIGTRLGLRSGMDWERKGLPPVGQNRSKWDAGHLEWDSQTLELYTAYKSGSIPHDQQAGIHEGVSPQVVSSQPAKNPRSGKG